AAGAQDEPPQEALSGPAGHPGSWGSSGRAEEREQVDHGGLRMTRRGWVRLFAGACAILATRLLTPSWCGRDADRWFDGDPTLSRELAAELIAFEAGDDRARSAASGDRFAGEWALVTHQMIALGLAQIALAHPD